LVGIHQDRFVQFHGVPLAQRDFIPGNRLRIKFPFLAFVIALPYFQCEVGRSVRPESNRTDIIAVHTGFGQFLGREALAHFHRATVVHAHSRIIVAHRLAQFLLDHTLGLVPCQIHIVDPVGGREILGRTDVFHQFHAAQIFRGRIQNHADPDIGIEPVFANPEFIGAEMHIGNRSQTIRADGIRMRVVQTNQAHDSPLSRYWSSLSGWP